MGIEKKQGKEVENEEIKDFILRFLDGIAKRGITEITEESLEFYVKYVVRDGRHNSLISESGLILPKETLDKSINIIPSPYFFGKQSKNRETVLELNAETLNRYTEVTSPLNLEQQSHLDKIVDDWVALNEKNPQNHRNSESIISIFNFLPNGNYVASRGRDLGSWASFNRALRREPKEERIHWDILTDGNLSYTTYMPALGNMMADPRGGILERGLSHRNDITGANYVGLQGLSGDQLLAVKLFTVARGEELTDIIMQASCPHGDRHLTKETPHIKMKRFNAIEHF